jgi:hypothetical protein
MKFIPNPNYENARFELNVIDIKPVGTQFIIIPKSFKPPRFDVPPPTKLWSGENHHAFADWIKEHSIPPSIQEQ